MVFGWTSAIDMILINKKYTGTIIIFFFHNTFTANKDNGMYFTNKFIEGLHYGDERYYVTDIESKKAVGK